MVQMAREREWRKWQRQELSTLGESIAWAASVFETTEVGVEGPRHYGVALLAHSIECARAIRLLISKGSPGPAFALSRAQYEGALRGHIMTHEIGLDELNELLDQARQWSQARQSQQPPGRGGGPPRIEIRGQKWSVVPKTKAGAHSRSERPLQCEIAKIWQDSAAREMRVLHDLTHSGLTHAFQMLDEDGYIGHCYSAMNQTLLLYKAQKAVMFAIMTWPGVEQKYCREIEQRVAALSKQWSIWEPHIGIPIG